MENNIKQTIESIDVPMDKLDAAILAGLNQKKKPRKWQIAALSSVAALSLVVGSVFISPTMAGVLANIPLIGPMFSIEDDHKGLQVALNDDNMVELNNTVTSAGISITFEKVVYDGERISVIFSMDEYLDIWPLSLYVDGELINNDESLRELDGEGRYRGLWEFVAVEPLPDAFDFKLQVNYIDGIEGDWHFTTPLEKVENEQHVIEVAHKGTIGEISFEIQSVTRSNTATTIAVQYGLTIEEQFDTNTFFEAKVFDQTGMPLHLTDQQYDEHESSTIAKYIFEPTDTNELDLYILQSPAVIGELVENKAPLQASLPQTISLGDLGDITITESTKNGTEHTLSLQVNSDFPFDHWLSPIGFDLQNEAGESIVTKWTRAVAPNEYEISYQSNAGQPIIRTIDLSTVDLTLTPKISIPLQ